MGWTMPGIMNITLWILQFLLAAVFLAHGLMLLFPPAPLIEQMNASMSTGFRVFLGVAEVLATVGLILPGLTRVMPWLVVSAAAGVMIVMVSATVFHAARGEWSSTAITFVLLLLATFVAYGRWKVLPIGPRKLV
jgi:putative oxidoreductase